LEFELVNVPDEYDVKNDKDNPFASASARSIMSTSQRGHSRQRLSSIFSPLSLAIDFLQGEQKKIEEQGVCESPKTLCDVYVLLSLFDRLSFFGVYWIMEEFIPYLKYANIIGFSYGAAIAAAIKTNLTGSDFLSHFEKLSAENSNDKLNLNKIMVLMSDENTATSNGEPTQMIGFETESYADTIKSMFGNIEKNRIKHLAIITNDKVSSSISSSSISSSSASSSSISSSSISSSSVSSSSASSSSISSSSVSSSSVSSSEESEYDKLYAGTNANLLSYHVIRSITSYTLENIKKYKLVVADDYLREIMKHSHKADAVVLNVYTNYSPEPNSTSVSVYPSSTLSSKGCEILRIDICLCIAEDERSLENIKEKIDQKRSSSGINEIYENLVKFLEPWHNGIISYKKGGSLPRSV
jgi:hypothetical protein